MALGSTQPLTEMSTRSIYWGKCGRCTMLTTYHHPTPLSRNLGKLTSWNSLGPLQACNGTVVPLRLYATCLTASLGGKIGIVNHAYFLCFAFPFVCQSNRPPYFRNLHKVARSQIAVNTTAIAWLSLAWHTR